MDDNFFELGGHSLLAVKLFAEIEKSFSQTLPVSTLFQAPTVRRLAEILSQARIEPTGEVAWSCCNQGGRGPHCSWCTWLMVSSCGTGSWWHGLEQISRSMASS